ncbi:hypothetical protein F8388_003738 [Cannabis sativa]|uniref:Uncharacterized protein n=1 Tax=Cannabis sativa TaxID=3483 RepID=A0A7J6F9R5_CANSA|nr:hypothetical protein F8388_003738 [Cannabis sativa]KAF4400947.1 hypothetical protein G4B88_013788 [Cannabis sativa]
MATSASNFTSFMVIPTTMFLPPLRHPRPDPYYLNPLALPICWLYASLSDSMLGQIEGLTAFSYLQKLQSLCNTLASVGEPISDQDHLTYLLNGLGLEYDAFVTPILARPIKPTIEEVHALLLSYKARINRQTTAASISSL